MKPTLHLRWVECFDDNDITPKAIIPGYQECDNTEYKLQQKWVNEDGSKKEWHDIEIDYSIIVVE